MNLATKTFFGVLLTGMMLAAAIAITGAIRGEDPAVVVASGFVALALIAALAGFVGAGRRSA